MGGKRKPQKQFLDIPTAAVKAGYSPRHFRRIIEEQGIPVVRIGRKFFILGRDFERWKLMHQPIKIENALDETGDESGQDPTIFE